jgi:hypothetical protein
MNAQIKHRKNNQGGGKHFHKGHATNKHPPKMWWALKGKKEQGQNITPERTN